MNPSPNLVHAMDLRDLIKIEQQNRHDILSNIEGTVYRISFLSLTQTIIYTAMDGTRGGTIKLQRPMASRHPQDSLLINEVVNHMTNQDSDTRKVQWPTQYV